jgi:hypothetical protein
MENSVQICRFYNSYATTSKATMRIKRKPGWRNNGSGLGWSKKHNLTGEDIAYVFGAALLCSQYANVEAFLSRNTENWITAHLHAFQFYRGITRMIVPDEFENRGRQTLQH